MQKLLIASLAALTLLPATAMAAPPAHPAQRSHYDDQRHARWDHGREVRDYNRAHPWRAPFRYHRFANGERIQPRYYSRAYVIADYGRFRWARPGAHQMWVRHYDDALLVNTRTGRVVRVMYNVFR